MLNFAARDFLTLSQDIGRLVTIFEKDPPDQQRAEGNKKMTLRPFPNSSPFS